MTIELTDPQALNARSDALAVPPTDPQAPSGDLSTGGATDPQALSGALLNAEASRAESGYSAAFFDVSEYGADIKSVLEIDFSRRPVHEGTVDQIDYSGYASFWEGGRGNLFAAEYTAGLYVEEAGVYTFYLTADGGAQLSLGGGPVIETAGLSDVVQQSVTVTITSGFLPLELLYVELRGDQRLNLQWSGPDTDGQVVNLTDVVSSPVPPNDVNVASITAEIAPMTISTSDVKGFYVEFFDLSEMGFVPTALEQIDFSATPVHSDVVATVDISGEDKIWEGGRGNLVGARYSAALEIETAGTYTFELTSDHQSQLKIGDEVVKFIDSGGEVDTRQVTLQLAAGTYALELLYFEARGEQQLNLQWSGPDTGGALVDLDSTVLLESHAESFEKGTGGGEGTGETGGGEGTGETGGGEGTGETGGGEGSGETGGGSGEGVTPELPRLVDDSAGDGPVRLEAVALDPDATLAVAGGRTTTLKLESDKEIASIEITDGPAFGHVTVNPDNSLALVLSGTDDSGALSFGYKVTYADGSSAQETVELDVGVPTQGAGWGLGEHYMLATDAAGDVIVETGENHRKVYVSGSEDALSLADIAAREGLAVEDIDGKWLLEHPQYGGSEGLALTSEAGMEIWYELTIGKQATPGSHWLLFENGYSYTDLGKIVGAGATGESELHPLHITSWGEGPIAVINNGFSISQKPTENLVISKLDVTAGLNVKEATNILVSDTEFTGTIMNVRGSDGFTLHDSSISYTMDDTDDGSGVTQGLLAVNSSGLLLEGNIFHHNAWEEGYNTEDGTGGAPDMYSHNVYLQWDTRDVTYRDNISSQGASFGAQFRGGVFAEDNLFLDNNVALNFLGGNYKDFGHVGNFTFFADNVITSGAYKDAKGIGGKGWGATNAAMDSTMLENIVAHLADPDDPADLADKQVTRFAVSGTDDSSFFYEDTKVLNWLAADPRRWKEEAMDRNLEDVDVAKAMETTIQRYAAELTGGDVATIKGLMDYILSLAHTTHDDVVTASVIVDYFQNGFGMDLDTSTAADSHRFVPNDLASGMRWDNRINWDSGELPDAGDDVDLGGNHVYFGTMTVAVDTLDLGAGGALTVTSGRLDVASLATGGGTATVRLDGAGQFWTADWSGGGQLQVDAEGGRFVNTGLMAGDLDIRLGDNAQAILASADAKMRLEAGSLLRIEGSEVRVGFDGDVRAPSVLQMTDGATLSFVADAQGVSSIGEFRSGVWDQQGSPVRSGVSLDGTLQIDLSAYTGGVGSFELIRADALHGLFDEIEIYGLGSGLTARTVIDFETDVMWLEITSGSAAPTLELIGAPDRRGSDDPELWGYVTEGQETIDTLSPAIETFATALTEPDFLL